LQGSGRNWHEYRKTKRQVICRLAFSVWRKLHRNQKPSGNQHLHRSRKEADINHVQALESLKQPYGSVALEVMKAMTFYSYSDGMEQEPVKDMFLCGGSANIEMLRNAIVKATDMTPHHITKLLKVSEDQTALAMRCGLAAGAAMQNPKEG